MKKCPQCQNTFEDDLRFCQNDGTVLEDIAPVDPFATMVIAKPTDDEPLQIPDFDPNKTVVFSTKDEMDVLATPPPPPSFGETGDVPPPPTPSFSAPPPPIAQPDSQPISPPAMPSSAPSFAEPEQVYQPQPSPFDSPFSAPQQAGASGGWEAPPAPVQQWSDQASGIGSNTPFQPPGAGVGGQSKGLAIASMICGILSIPGLCCWVGILLGPAGAIMGFIARNKANSDPVTYGGGGMALAGIITGVIGTLMGVGLIILYILGFALQGMNGRF
jgi:Domain of unknown function (DUF4190)